MQGVWRSKNLGKGEARDRERTRMQLSYWLLQYSSGKRYVHLWRPGASLGYLVQRHTQNRLEDIDTV